MKKIYLFNNSWVPGRPEHDWNVGYALAEDGNVLASHVSSNNEWLKHDLGLTNSQWQHEKYNKHYGIGGWELVWIDDATANDNQGFNAALKLNEELRAKAEAAGIED